MQLCCHCASTVCIMAFSRLSLRSRSGTKEKLRAHKSPSQGNVANHSHLLLWKSSFTNCIICFNTCETQQSPACAPAPLQFPQQQCQGILSSWARLKQRLWLPRGHTGNTLTPWHVTVKTFHRALQASSPQRTVVKHFTLVTCDCDCTHTFTLSLILWLISLLCFAW